MRDQDELRRADRPGRRSRCPTRSPRTASTSTAPSRRARSSRRAAAYLELHIEQGPVLESMGIPLGAVLGTYGVERWRITWKGQAAHAGSTPMDKRRDALAGAAKLALEIREIAARVGNGAVCTSGGVVCRAGDRDLGRRDGRAAARPAPPRRGEPRRAPLARRRRRASASPRRRTSRSSWERIWNIEPILFDPALIDLCDEACRERRRHLAPAAVRAAPRRGRGRPRGRPDRDDVRPEPSRPLAHEARGHARGAPRARRRRRSTGSPTARSPGSPDS